MAEKAATKRFMEDAGYRLGAENQRQCRIFWSGSPGGSPGGSFKKSNLLPPLIARHGGYCLGPGSPED
ncbi:hypothetical protein N7467_004156 [Penicillium canescens]|nr:hypothetical protein N7467_004156 [Penicillium canescens]